MKRDDPGLSATPSDEMTSRGKEDGYRGFPGTEVEGRSVIGWLVDRFLTPRRQANAARVEQELSAMKARTDNHAVEAQDVLRGVSCEAARGASAIDNRLGQGRLDLAAAAHAERARLQALQDFREEFRDELGDREPLPRQSRWQRIRSEAVVWMVALLVIALEVGSFVALGADALREAIPRGVIGGLLSAALVGCLQRLLRRRRTHRQPGQRRRDTMFAALVLLLYLMLAYGMACMRDALLQINGQELLTLAQILKPPHQLSPDSGLVLGVAIVLMLVMVVLERGRRPVFPQEDELRELVAAHKAALAAYKAAGNALDDGVKAEAKAARDGVQELVDGWARATRSASTDFSDASARIRHWHQEDADVVAHAKDMLDVYCRANLMARGFANPLPAVLQSPTPFEPSPGLHRNLLAGFADELAHVRQLEQAAHHVASQVQAALTAYETDVVRFVTRLRANPLTQELAPRYHATLELTVGPAFGAQQAGAAPGAGVIAKFLGED